MIVMSSKLLENQSGTILAKRLAQSPLIYCSILSGRCYLLCQELSRVVPSPGSWRQMAFPEFTRTVSFGGTSVVSRCTSRQQSESVSSLGSFSQGGVSTYALLEAIEEALAKHASDELGSGSYAFTLSYPRSSDSMTFEVASAGFEELAGYSRHELLGKNLRFLTHAFPENLSDRIARNLSDKTGVPFETAISIQSKTGERKACRVLQRGLNLAFDPEEGGKLWVLLSAYMDLSDVEDSDIDTSEILESMTENIRSKISNAVAGLSTMVLHDKKEMSPGCWRMLPPCP